MNAMRKLEHEPEVCSGVGGEVRSNIGPSSCGFGMDIGPLTFDVNSKQPCPVSKQPEGMKSPAGLRRRG